MSQVSFGAGTLVVGFATGYSTFMGFPVAFLSNFTDPGFEADAVGVSLLDLVRWRWRVKSWTVVFDAAYSAIGISPLTQTFVSLATDEVDLISSPVWRSNEMSDIEFEPVIAIEPGTGNYGLSTFINQATGLGNLASIVSGSGSGLNFSDSVNNIVATEASYWPYA